MVFLLKVTSGIDQGKTFSVEPGECIIGRAPTSTIVLADESVAWEHARLKSDGERLLLQNLSAAGTRVKGRRVTGDQRLASNEEIELSKSCRIVVRHQLGGGGIPAQVKVAAVVLMVAALAAGGFGALSALRKPDVPPPRDTQEFYQTAYSRLEVKIEDWVRAHWFPEEALNIFRVAWRLELAHNPQEAALRWDHLRSLLLTMPVPGPFADKRTIAEAASPTSEALKAVGGWDRDAEGVRWDNDTAYADALAWFVRRRAEYTRRQVEEGRQ